MKIGAVFREGFGFDYYFRSGYNHCLKRKQIIIQVWIPYVCIWVIL
jgi:hypothetical protein